MPPKKKKSSASRKRDTANVDPTAASVSSSRPLSSKGSMTVKFPVKCIKYHGLEEAISTAREVSLEHLVTVFLSSAVLKLRQGLSTDGGSRRSFWNITFRIDSITAVALDVKEDELIYTFKSGFDFQGDADTEKAEDLPKPSSFPLATAHLKNQVVEITLGLPNPNLWKKQSETVFQALRGGRFSISEEEQGYIATNRQAINKEAEEEHKTLAVRGCQVKGVAVGERILLGIWPKEERPFRLYRGCNLVLRGEQFFRKEDAKAYLIRGQKDAPEDWMAEVAEDSPKWRGLIDAPVHAILLNQVYVTLVDKVQEDDVKVHKVSNFLSQATMLAATKKLSEHWGEESFDAMCREFENHDAKLPVGNQRKLPLSSMFLSSTPRVNTYDPIDASLMVGLPGTGKTRAVAAATILITQMLRLRGSTGKARLAVLVPTHAADAVLKQLSKAFELYKYRSQKLYVSEAWQIPPRISSPTRLILLMMPSE